MSLPATSDAAHALPRGTTSIPTVAAIGILDYVLATLVHEALGHGAACLVVDGRPAALTSAWLDCRFDAAPTWAQPIVSAGGTLANLAAGAAAIAILRRVPTYRGATWYAIWLFAAVNLFMGGGCLFISPILGFGDWSFEGGGLAPMLPWKLALCAAGALTSVGSLVVLVRLIDPLLGVGRADRLRAARVLAWLPYAAGCAVVSIAAFANPLGVEYVATSALATFGGTSFLAWLPAWVRARRDSRVPALDVPADAAWIAIGLVAAALCVGILGRGIVRAI